ncbi:MAG: hypothetical protein LKE36_03530 [Bacilli bacterium]|jgi:hypothetical protein|nr:hypothetical protein [Bacilli bacterium]
MKKINSTSRLKTRLAVTLVALAFSLTSLFYISYAWFQFVRSKQVEVMDVSVPQGIEYSLKYFVGNGENGYPGPDMFSNDTNASVTDYENDFLPVPENYGENYTFLKEPGYRQTFAIELSSDLNFPQNINLALSEFTSVASLSRFNNNSQEGIRLAEAINIYIADINGADTNSAITSEANTFVQSQNPPGGDLFDGSDQTHILATSTLGGSSSQKKIFLLTIEFSDTSDTYYSFDHTDSGIDYYNKSITGNSNVYQNLEFVINKLEITTINE